MLPDVDVLFRSTPLWQAGGASNVSVLSAFLAFFALFAPIVGVLFAGACAFLSVPIEPGRCAGARPLSWQCTDGLWQIVAFLPAVPAMSKRIAIVEDEAAIRENYAAAFRREGYSVELYAARQPALEAFESRLPDLVVIDINLKDDVEGGFELCRRLRQMSNELPIIFLTARDSEFDAVSGLRLGADDYLTKDLSLPHLMARIAALFRRLDAMQQPDSGDSLLRRGELELDVDRMTVRWRERPVGLTLTEFWMVHALARYPGHVKNRQQLMDAAQAVLDDNTITSHIKRIRKKFVAVDPEFDGIETVYGMGYRWLGS